MSKPVIAIAVLLGVAALAGGAWALLRHEPRPGPRPAPRREAASGPRSPIPHPQSFEAPCPIRFQEVTGETGITFLHTDGSSGRRYIVEAMSTGIATLDYDGDGLIDIYFPNGALLPGATADKPPRHALYRNRGGWRFEEVTDAAGVVCTGYGLGIGVGDYDNDGHPDIYLNHFGPNVLWRNNGDGTFTDATAQAGVARGNLVGAGACFLDADGDGWLDLYVGNYIHLDCAAHVPHVAAGFPTYPSPLEYAPVPDTLYRNNGDGTFSDVSEASGIGNYAGRSMGMICADYDHDGDTDAFLCNDVMENFLFRNDGAGRFQEVGTLVGAALNGNGETLANMGVDCGDYNNDGLLDFFSTNYQAQWPVLYRNLRHGMLEDVTHATNAGAGCLPHVNWGLGMADLDNDGHKDLFIGNGHTEDNIELRDRSATYRCLNIVQRNTGDGRFVNVSEGAGLNQLPRHAARGVALDDLDNDGDIDVVILNSRERPTLLRNMLSERGSPHRWLQVELRGVKTNRDGVGAQVKVFTGPLVQVDEVHSGRGYQSHWGTRLHFGLGLHERVDRLEVRWIGGGMDVLEDIPPNQRIQIIEGSHSPVRLPGR